MTIKKYYIIIYFFTLLILIAILSFHFYIQREYRIFKKISPIISFESFKERFLEDEIFTCDINNLHAYFSQSTLKHSKDSLLFNTFFSDSKNQKNNIINFFDFIFFLTSKISTVSYFTHDVNNQLKLIVIMSGSHRTTIILYLTEAENNYKINSVTGFDELIHLLDRLIR